MKAILLKSAEINNYDLKQNYIKLYKLFSSTEDSINGNTRVPIPSIDLEMSQQPNEEAQKMTFHDNQLNESATTAEDHKPKMYEIPNCIVHKLPDILHHILIFGI